MRGPNFIKLGEDIRPSSLLAEFVSELIYFAAFSNVIEAQHPNTEGDEGWSGV